MFKKKETEKKKRISLPTIHIVLKRTMGKVPVIVGEFDAFQEKDNNYNIVMKNDEFNFKEEIDFVKKPIIEFLTYKLELKNLSKEDKIKKINDKIQSLEEDLNRIVDGTLEKEVIKKDVNGKETKVKEKVDVNRIDIENEVNNFKTLKYSIQNEGEGSFEIINMDGERQIEFCMIEGVVTPIFHRTNTDKGTFLTTYPDITTKRKIYNEKSDRILDDYLKSQNEGIFSGIKAIITIVAICTLFIIAGIIHVRLNARASAMDDEIGACRDELIRQTARSSEYYLTLLEHEIINRSIIYEQNLTQERQGITSIVDISNRLVGDG